MRRITSRLTAIRSRENGFRNAGVTAITFSG